MKTFWTTLLLIVALAMVGCAQPPQTIKNAMYTAQLSLAATVNDVATATKEPWIVPPNITIEEKLALRERQVIVLTRTMEQVNKNLKTAIDWFRFGKTPD